MERLEHYFLTYKLAVDAASPEPLKAERSETEIAGVYGCDEAREVIARGLEDYRAHFPELKEQILAALRGTA